MLSAAKHLGGSSQAAVRTSNRGDPAAATERNGGLSTTFAQRVIPSADFMILRLTTVHEKAWIPAFAGMTPGGHPRGSGGPLVAASAISIAARNLALSFPFT